MGIRVDTATPKRCVSARMAAFKFGFWGMLGAMGAFGLGLLAIRGVRWAEVALRTWSGL